MSSSLQNPVIDFHTHLFPDRLMDALYAWFEKNVYPVYFKEHADSLVAHLRQQGVTRCVSLYYAHKSGMADALNKWAYQLSLAYPDFVYPFGSIHPDDVKPEKLLQTCFENYQFKGIKIHCHVQKVAPDDPRMEVIYKTCEAYQKILLIHCGTGPHFLEQATEGYGYDVTRITVIQRFEKVIKKFPKLIWIVPHFGYEEVKEFRELLKDYPNLYLDTTMVLADYYQNPFQPEWLSQHADRILFGTDFPIIPYKWSTEKEKLLSFKLDKKTNQKILYQNAAKLLGIKQLF